MRIFWFLHKIEQQNGKWTSQLASARLRGLELIYEMSRSYPDAKIHINPELNDASFGEYADTEPSVAVFGKILENMPNVFEFLKSRGIPIIIDLCDDQSTRVWHPRCLEFADLFICSTPGLADIVKSQTNTEIIVIPDTYEGPELVPNKQNLDQKPSLNALWFGNQANLVGLFGCLPSIAEKLPNRLRIKVLTRIGIKPILEAFEANKKLYENVIELDLETWTPETMTANLQACDFVIVPVSPSQFNNVKTSNRVVTAIRAGKPCVANPIASYQEFSDFIEINEDITDGIFQLLKTPEAEQEQKILDAQSLIRNSYSPKVITEKWVRVLRNTAKPALVKEAAIKPNAPVRLNLGCGDKILPEYTNVDIVDERAGNKPDTICDIRNLTVFEDNHADEILTVHVIEHFHYWEVSDVLSEWVRVLKPGGRMIIECPNLLTACEEIIKNPVSATKPGKEGQRSMWVLYGDPAWKDPLMCHKWLYTPQSLANLMQSCGLKEIRQEAAQFKLREPRDMRIVGVK